MSRLWLKYHYFILMERATIKISTMDYSALESVYPSTFPWIHCSHMTSLLFLKYSKIKDVCSSCNSISQFSHFSAQILSLVSHLRTPIEKSVSQHVLVLTLLSCLLTLMATKKCPLIMPLPLHCKILNDRNFDLHYRHRFHRSA